MVGLNETRAVIPVPPHRTPDQRLFPAKLAAALISLAFMIGFFDIALERGPNDLYAVVVGVLTAGLAIAILVTLVRRHRRGHR